MYKKIWYSIRNFEKYPEMAAEGVWKAIGYLAGLMLIFAIIVAIVGTFKFSNSIEEVVKYINENISDEIKYEDGILTVGPNAETINLNENSVQFYIAYGGILVILVFIMYFLSTLLDILMLSIFGLFTSWIAKIKMRYRAVFNMSVYAVTLSVILELIYIIVSMFTDFKIKYFDLMYTAIAYICLVAAIFMIKSDVIKQQIELIKILQKEQENKQREEEDKEEPEEKENNEEKNDEKKDEKKEKEEKGLNDNGAEGSKA